MLYTNYDGTFSVPSFDSASATTGCFGLTLGQPERGTIGQSRHAATAVSDNATGGGGPQIADYGFAKDYGSGTVAGLTISNLTRTSGSGTITLDNGVVGTITITGSVQYYGFARRPHYPHFQSRGR